MKASTCCCSCKNIKIKGKIIPNCMYPNIPLTEKNHLRLCKNLFSVQQHSIEIQNFDRVCCHTLSKYCSNMKCSACGETYLFFSWSGYSYFGKMQNFEKNNKLLQNSSKISKNIKMNDCSNSDNSHDTFFKNDNNGNIASNLPNIFKILIKNNKNKLISHQIEPKKLEQTYTQKVDAKYALKRSEDEEKIFSNDADFELMFSNEYSPYIGSYMQGMNIFNDLIDEKNIFYDL